jgi:hypothetical protein
VRISDCSKCKRLAFVNVATRRGKICGEYCAECFDEIDHDAPPRNKTGGSSGENHNNPWLDNAIKELEEGN